ncbi:hypothetical protein ACOAKC_00840 [Hathewaya histolytica]|uniref:hypothetical protein n=1 Tax=Hathewaya histolytica TaxID=1498 RepID=UPI003B6809D8
MGQKILGLIIILLGVFEAYLGLSLPEEREVDENAIKENFNEINKSFVKFQRAYFVLMGLYTGIIGVINFIKPVKLYITLMLIALPIIINKLLGQQWLKKFRE